MSLATTSATACNWSWTLAFMLGSAMAASTLIKSTTISTSTSVNPAVGRRRRIVENSRTFLVDDDYLQAARTQQRVLLFHQAVEFFQLLDNLLRLLHLVGERQVRSLGRSAPVK